MRDKQPKNKSSNRTLSALNDLLQIILDSDPYLHPYREIIERRLNHIAGIEKKLTGNHRKSLADFASGHEYFGLHKHDHEWIFREWAPNANKIFLSAR